MFWGVEYMANEYLVLPFKEGGAWVVSPTSTANAWTSRCPFLFFFPFLTWNKIKPCPLSVFLLLICFQGSSLPALFPIRAYRLSLFSQGSTTHSLQAFFYDVGVAATSKWEPPCYDPCRQGSPVHPILFGASALLRANSGTHIHSSNNGWQF